MAEHGARFVGTFEHGLDDKGRMVLPAKIRGHLGDSGVLAKLDRCLGLWTKEGFAEVTERLRRNVEDGLATANALRVFLADAAEVSPDGQGRIVVPQRLRTYADLDRDAVITGRGDRVEVWDAPTWWALAEDADAELAEAITSLRI